MEKESEVEASVRKFLRKRIDDFKSLNSGVQRIIIAGGFVFAFGFASSNGYYNFDELIYTAFYYGVLYVVLLLIISWIRDGFSKG